MIEIDASVAIVAEESKMPIALEQRKEIIIKVNLRMEPKTPFESERGGQCRRMDSSGVTMPVQCGAICEAGEIEQLNENM